jgi:hypothetical protein
MSVSQTISNTAATQTATSLPFAGLVSRLLAYRAKQRKAAALNVVDPVFLRDIGVNALELAYPVK